LKFRGDLLDIEVLMANVTDELNGFGYASETLKASGVDSF